MAAVARDSYLLTHSGDSPPFFVQVKTVWFGPSMTAPGCEQARAFPCARVGRGDALAEGAADVPVTGQGVPAVAGDGVRAVAGDGVPGLLGVLGAVPVELHAGPAVDGFGVAVGVHDAPVVDGLGVAGARLVGGRAVVPGDGQAVGLVVGTAAAAPSVVAILLIPQPVAAIIAVRAATPSMWVFPI